MVDPENLVFVQRFAHGLVDRAVRRQIVAERLLQHQPDLLAVQAGRGDLLDDLLEQIGRRREVHHDDVGIASFQHLREARVIAGLR